MIVHGGVDTGERSHYTVVGQHLDTRSWSTMGTLESYFHQHVIQLLACKKISSTTLFDVEEDLLRTFSNTIHLSVYLSIFICPESSKTQCVSHMQRTGQCDHNGTEHCPKYMKTTKKNNCLRIRPDEKLTIAT